VNRLLIFAASIAVISPCFLSLPAAAQRADVRAPEMLQALTDASLSTLGSGGPDGVQGQVGGFGVVYSFKGSDGAAPTATLVQDASGNFYGTTSAGGSGFGVVFKIDRANRERVLHVFTGSPADGATPYGALVLDNLGNLYGTTSTGGSSNLGTVFKIDTYGTETVLHSFSGSPDGANPYAGLAIDGSGNLYGTTENGGTSGLGTVFKVSASGTESVLHSFSGSPTDGATPMAGVTLDPAGNLYGTTYAGGANGVGTIFEVDTAGTESVVYSFTGGVDGGNPFGGLTRDANGTFYGTAESGGSLGGLLARSGVEFVPEPDGPHGCCRGVAYALSGDTQKVLYTFTGSNDGGTPVGTLVLSNGVLYGTTLAGGRGHNGTAFSITIASGQESVLHGFSGSSDGGNPSGGLMMSSSGALYGTAEKGGRFKNGVIFKYKLK
jgi:uncharacterized repeat protein (TIGR03803 family)